MATKAQLEAARANIKKAQAASRTKRALGHLAKSTRRGIGTQGATARIRLGEPERALEDRNRQQLYALASQHRVAGRATMGKPELIEAIRRVR